MQKDIVQVIDIVHITNPLCVSFCGNKRIAVLEPDCLTVLKRKTQNVIIKENKQKMFDLAVSKDGKKVAVFGDGCLSVYSSYTNTLHWQKSISHSSFFPIAFNSQDNTQVLLYKKKYNTLVIYTDELIETQGVELADLEANYLFAHHPHKTEIIYGFSDTGSYLCSDYKRRIQSFHQNHLIPCLSSFVAGQEYSCDGSYIAVTTRMPAESRVVFMKCDDFNDFKCIKELHHIVAMAFHPNNKIIFFLYEDNCLKCWNFLNQQLMYTISFDQLEYIPLQKTLEKRLAVSPNGKRLCIAFKNKCSIVPVPFNVLYTQEEQERLFSILLLLKLYENDVSDTPGENKVFSLPNDIIFVLAKKILSIFRYSFMG